MIRFRLNCSLLEVNMRMIRLAIVGFLVAQVPFAAPAGAWPGDGYYYAPYPPAIAMMPPPPYPRPIMLHRTITLLPSPPMVRGNTAMHRQRLLTTQARDTQGRVMSDRNPCRCRPARAAAANTAIGTAIIAPTRAPSVPMSDRNGDGVRRRRPCYRPLADPYARLVS
jgi:hypothetical protein